MRQSRPCPRRSIDPADDRFDELAQRLGGFYLSWVIYLGLELGLFERIRAAGGAGISPDATRDGAGCRPEPVEAWVRAAHASELVVFDGERLTLGRTTASVLLDDSHPEYLGGQFVAAVVSSLDYAGLPGSSGPAGRSTSGRRGSTARSRRSPSRTSRSSSRRDSRQLPDLVATLSRRRRASSTSRAAAASG